jgi:hypothetical protein
MDENRFNQLVEAWIAHEEASSAPERKKNWWAAAQILDWMVDPEAVELLWRFIMAVYPRDLSDKAVASLAAGPLEDLLSHCGPDYIDRVEKLARQDRKFNRLLGGVWRLAMTDDVWRRVQAVRLEVW